MKYIAVLDTDDYEDFAFFEDGKEKYLHGIDAGATNGEWIYLPFKSLEQEPKSEWEHDHEILKAYSDGQASIITVLEDIKAEMENLKDNRCFCHHYERGINDCINVLNKHMESEDKEWEI